MSFKKNILANYVGGGILVLAPMLALPWYLSLLGTKQFGLLGFIATLQAFLALLDAGMSQALVREFTLRFDFEQGKKNAAAALLFGFERIYWIFSLVIGFVIALLASAIATHWLNLGDLPIELGQQAVYGAAALFVVQFPGSVYRSLLVGAQAQVKLNGIMLSGSLLRHFGAVLVILVWPTLLAYLLWHILISFLETLVRGKSAWSILGAKRNSVGWKVDELKPVWRMIVSMSAAVLLGALTVQMDKIVLSRMVSIEQFGYYVIASTVATGLLQLIYPLTQAVLPRAIQLRTQLFNLHILYVKLFKAIVLVALVTIVGYILFGKLILNIWLRSTQVVEVVYPLLAVLLIGTLLNVFYNIGYINWIVHEKTQRIFQVNLLSLLFSLICVPVFIIKFGMIGAAFSWIIINLIGLILSLEWIRHK